MGNGTASAPNGSFSRRWGGEAWIGGFETLPVSNPPSHLPVGLGSVYINRRSVTNAYEIGGVHVLVESR